MSSLKVAFPFVLVAATACGGARPPGQAAPGSPAPVLSLSGTALKSASSKTSAPSSSSAPSPAVFGPARLFPPTQRGDVATELFDADGSRRVVAQGLRMIERPDGSLEAAHAWLPTSRGLKVTELPARLGGGFIFAAPAGGSTLLYAAPTWTGPLRPVARLETEVHEVQAGFDRLYLLVGRGQWVALDPKSGRSMDLGSLPPSAGYGAMAFADEWFGVVVAPYRGALATFDAGGTWHALGLPVATVMALGDSVVVVASGESFFLDANGAMQPLPTSELPAAGPAVGAERRPLVSRSDSQKSLTQTLRPLGPRPLETAVLHGWPERDGTAIVAAGGMLARVRLEDGALLARAPDAYPGVAACEAVPLGTGGGFVCGEPGGATSIYAYQPPLALRLVRTFAEPRRVAPSGNGALVVNGRCAAQGANARAYCVLPRSGEPWELPVRELGVERVVALARGGAARLVPARLGTPGSLVVVTPGAPERPIALELPKRAEATALALLRDGLWLDSFEEGPGGELRGWTAGAGSFAGVRVGKDGKVRVGPVQQYLDRALLSGAFGFVVSRAGAALETTDGGFEWNDVELVTEPDWKPQRTQGLAQGCTRLGCAFSGWLRVGWGADPRGRLAISPAPERAELRLPGGSRWSLDCSPTGEVSRPALSLPPERSDREQGAPSPLAEVPPPPRAASDRLFDTGSEPELHGYRAYAWGPPLEAWPKSARWLARVIDPHTVKDAVWSTVSTSVPWASPELTADAFGQSANGPPSSSRLVPDPLGRSALFVLNTRGASELFLLDEGKEITRLKTSGAVGAVSSFVRAGRSSYVGALGEAQTLRVFRVESGTLVLVGEYTDVLARTELPVLAPSARGDGLALWVRSGNYYVYPLDPTTGRLDQPIEVSADSLGAMPRPCAPDEDGYVVGDALALEPRIDLYGAPYQVGNGIEVRLIVSPRDICVDSVAAPAGGPAQRTRPPPARQTSAGVRMVLSDPRPGGVRRSFRCWD